MSKVCRAPCAIAVWLLAACIFSFVTPDAKASASSASSAALIEADSDPGLLRGIVWDPSGAKVPNAVIYIHNHDASLTQEIFTDSAGSFSVRLSAGTYELVIQAHGFRPYRTSVDIKERGAHTIDARLTIDAAPEEITVPSAEILSTDAADNKSALVFKNDDLKEFSDNDSTFQQEILALAGGGGLRPPQVFVDGFSNTPFPPKNTILEIRINQNPYSAEYDQLGLGRVEISTKPGTEKFHGDFSSEGNDNAFNTSNPYVAVQPPYYNLDFNADLTGPLNGKTSFFTSARYDGQQNNALVDAIDPASLLPFSEALPAPQHSQTYTLRLDRKVSASNTAIGTYYYDNETFANSGVGQLVLPSAGLNLNTTTQFLNLRDTQVIGSKIISEAFFQYKRTRANQNPVSTGAAIVVEGVFTGGGNTAQTLRDAQDAFEFRHLLTVDHDKQYMRFGGRYRLLRDANFTTSNYNGQFTFPSLDAYQLAAAGQTPAQIFTETGETTQYNLTTGQPSATLLTGDLAVFAEDEWRVRSNLNFDFGFRAESQSAIPDHFDPAPRFGFAYGLRRKGAKRSIVVLRGGSGIFYDRFAASNILTAIRQQSGTIQPSFYVENPNFFQQYLNSPPPASSLSVVAPTLYNINPHLRSEYAFFSGFEADRSLGKYGKLSVYYTFLRGDHQYLSRNINAPLPGTYNPADPSSGVRPFGGTQNIYQFSSGGVDKAQTLFISSQFNFGKTVSGFLAYNFNRTKADVANATTFASNSYNLAQDYGRAALPEHGLYAALNTSLPWGFGSSLYATAQTSVPFNITTGTDLNGDSIYNDRPAFATNPTASSILYKTRFGTFDANPQPGEQIIPINYGNSPNYFFLSATLDRTFKFGTRPAGPMPAAGAPAAARPRRSDPPYAISFHVEADNVFNHVNPGLPVGVLSSPLFGKSISLNSPFSLGGLGTAGNRIVTLRMNLSF